MYHEAVVKFKHGNPLLFLDFMGFFFSQYLSATPGGPLCTEASWYTEIHVFIDDESSGCGTQINVIKQ